MPSLQGSAFDEEERSTDSEIENVLGVIESVPPKACEATVIVVPEAAPVPSSAEPVPSSPEAVPPAPEPRALPPDHETSAIEPGLEVLPPRDDRATFVLPAVALRRRQLVVITAVCASCALVLALAAVLLVVRGRAASERASVMQQATQLAPASPAADSPLSSSMDSPTPATPTAAASEVPARPAAAAPQSKASSRPPPSKGGSRPSSN